jgi:Flp pilus assembly pilin Flp
MFKKLIKNKKAQQTAEYALLISLVVAAVIAMQTYAQRTLQARVRDAGKYLTTQTSSLGNTAQYEPYYLDTDYQIDSSNESREIQARRADNSGLFRMETDSNRTRKSGGAQTSSYETSQGLINGI